MDAGRQLVIGAFQPFGGKSVNQADLVGRRLLEMRREGTLEVPADVHVTFVPMETTAESVDHFVQTARGLGADHVVMLGENGLGVHVEAKAFDRGQPAPLMATALLSLLPHPGAEESISTAAPVEAMARAGDARVSSDAGRYYCNYSYQSALRAGLNAVFIHVPAGLFGLGRDPEGAAQSVNRMLGTWYREAPNGTLLMGDGTTA